jgi:hypothetical protein
MKLPISESRLPPGAASHRIMLTLITDTWDLIAADTRSYPRLLKPYAATMLKATIEQALSNRR